MPSEEREQRLCPQPRTTQKQGCKWQERDTCVVRILMDEDINATYILPAEASYSLNPSKARVSLKKFRQKTNTC